MPLSDPNPLALQLGEIEFSALRRVLRHEAGLNFDEQGRFLVERRLGERIAELGLRGFGVYVRELETNAEELEYALEALTTKETYFFRQEYQLSAFVTEVVPNLVRASGEYRRLTVWSAGCASGEEAYTLAILLLECPLLAGWNIQIVGTDLCRSNIEQARRGIYRAGAFRVTPEDKLSEYFERSGLTYSVRPHIKKMCHFSQVNLVRPAEVRSVGRVDAIFCRNVLIYFDEEVRRHVTELLYERLMPGGYLFLGHTESLLNARTRFETVHLSSDLTYKRPIDSIRAAGGPR